MTERADSRLDDIGMLRINQTIEHGAIEPGGHSDSGTQAREMGSNVVDAKAPGSSVLDRSRYVPRPSAADQCGLTETESVAQDFACRRKPSVVAGHARQWW